MSIGSLGVVIGLAGSSAAQRSSETAPAPRESDAARARQTLERAEQAAGIGQTEEDTEASDRDADGRRLWEHPSGGRSNSAAPELPSDAAPSSKDPTGARGSELDLLG